jgi:hypothetical protein
MKHLTIMGWLWLLAGVWWSFLGFVDLCRIWTPSDRPWDFGDAIADLVCFGTLLCGLALICRWWWCRSAVWTVGSAWVISVGYLLWVGQSGGALTLLILQILVVFYSMSVLAFVRAK